jgi:hypothetical protein
MSKSQKKTTAKQNKEDKQQDIDTQEVSNENDQTESLDDLKAKITELEGAVLYAKLKLKTFVKDQLMRWIRPENTPLKILPLKFYL